MAILTLRSVSKRYGAVHALSDVSAEFELGEIHAVLGENGAGKSTLMGILGGFITPDSGEILGKGVCWPVGHPSDVRRAGLTMVHQHFTLVPEFTVAENLALSGMKGLAKGLNVGKISRPALELAQDLNWNFDESAKTRLLPVGVQQRVEILKALAEDPQILVLDEPTAVLSPDEVEDLFRVLRQLKARGKAVILIAHKLSEVMAIADRVTVIRRGKWIASAPIEEVNPTQLAAWMVGEETNVTAGVPSISTSEQFLSTQDLVVLGDRGESAVRKASFNVARGEIFGLGGVDGNGQVELAECLVGVRPLKSGSLTLPDGARIAYIPQDRQVDGLALSMSVVDNLLVSGHRKPALRTGMFLSPLKVRRWAEGLIQRFGIKVGSPVDPVKSLSGGNQQKVVVSRALADPPDLIVAVNPTRGLDIGATTYVHEQIRAAAAGGAAVVLISTDLDELAALASTRAFLSRGEIVAGTLTQALL